MKIYAIKNVLERLGNLTLLGLVILHTNLAKQQKTHCIFGGQATSKGRKN